MARIRFSNSVAPASLRASISRADRTLELLDLAAFEVGERELDPRARIALRDVDLLGDGVLVLAQPVVELVDRPATVVRLKLELLERTRERIARARLELLAEPDRRRSLRVDGGVELIGFGDDLRFDVGDALAHPLLQRRDGALERVLRALEIRLPRPQALLDALLDRCHELGHAL